jgi:hypothetical protein
MRNRIGSLRLFDVSTFWYISWVDVCCCVIIAEQRQRKLESIEKEEDVSSAEQRMRAEIHNLNIERQRRAIEMKVIVLCISLLTFSFFIWIMFMDFSYFRIYLLRLWKCKNSISSNILVHVRLNLRWALITWLESTPSTLTEYMNAVEKGDRLVLCMFIRSIFCFIF